jgi:hypothetical protein
MHLPQIMHLYPINKDQTPPAMYERNTSSQMQKQVNPVQNEHVSQIQYAQKPSHFSVAAGFSGSDLKNPEGYGAKGKGFFVNGAYHFDDSINLWIELDQQKSSDVYNEFSYMGNDVKVKESYDLSEIALGVQYKWNSDRLYAGIGTGFGFSRLKINTAGSAVIGGVAYVESESETYDYYTWRLADLELGAKFSKNLSVFADVGYKLLLSLETDTTCGAYYCESARAEEMDLDGLTYKAGLRYSF